MISDWWIKRESNGKYVLARWLGFWFELWLKVWESAAHLWKRASSGTSHRLWGTCRLDGCHSHEIFSDKADQSGGSLSMAGPIHFHWPKDSHLSNKSYKVWPAEDSVVYSCSNWGGEVKASSLAAICTI